MLMTHIVLQSSLLRNWKFIKNLPFLPLFLFQTCLSMINFYISRLKKILITIFPLSERILFFMECEVFFTRLPPCGSRKCFLPDYIFVRIFKIYLVFQDERKATATLIFTLSFYVPWEKKLTIKCDLSVSSSWHFAP